MHWVVTRGNVKTVDRVIARTYAWSDRKRRFSKQQILLALEVLTKKGWIPDTISTGNG